MCLWTGIFFIYVVKQLLSADTDHGLYVSSAWTWLEDLSTLFCSADGHFFYGRSEASLGVKTCTVFTLIFISVDSLEPQKPFRWCYPVQCVSAPDGTSATGLNSDCSIKWLWKTSDARNFFYWKVKQPIFVLQCGGFDSVGFCLVVFFFFKFVLIFALDFLDIILQTLH